MGEESSINQYYSQELPQILAVKPPPGFNAFEQFLSRRFQILKPWESPLPLDTFIKTHAHSVKAMLCSAATLVNADLLRLLPSLQLIFTASIGFNHIDLSECRARGIEVANAGNVSSEDVADMAMGLLLDVVKNISAGDRYVRRGLWAIKGGYRPLGSKLGGKRVGIVGLGNIGLEVGKRIQAFGCKVSYNSRKKKPFVSYPYYSSICELAANSDILIICCGLTDTTRHMINKEVLSALGKEGVIINISRGAVIDEKEMVRCLVQGEIKGAGLDVFENEPHVPTELFELDNVVLSAHRAAHTPESFSGIYELMAENLENFFENKPLPSLVKDD